MKRISRKYTSPWPTRHCVVHAWTHLGAAKPTAAAAVVLKLWALRTPCTYHAHRTLIDAKGTGYTRGQRDAAQWAERVGLRILGDAQYPDFKNFWRHRRYARMYGADEGDKYCISLGPTLAAWCRAHKRGRYLVFTEGHVQAVINGKVWGYHETRSRVQMFYQVEVV